MFFVVSKVFWFFAQPSSLITMLLIAGVLLSRGTRFTLLGWRLAALGLVLLLVAGLGPVSNMLILPLEQRFASDVPTLSSNPVAGIIILGGYEDGRTTERRGTLHLNEAAERLTEAARLAHKQPSLPVIISGGSGAIVLEDRPAALAIAEYLKVIGIAPERIRLEDKSITTYENAQFSARMLKPKPDQLWYLVTSAAHMPRSVGAFRRQGFQVIPWPVDFRTADTGDWRRPFGSIPAGLKRLDEAAMEWIGLLAYRLLGRTDALFPAP